MQEWDGLRTTSDRVLVVASTNRPFDLDEAVLRRLSRRVLVDLPNFATRLNILQVLLKGNRLDSSVNLTKIAQTLDGYSGSDIREICREAVVRVCNIKAKELTENSTSMDVVHVIQNTPLRPVSAADFDAAIKKLQASVNIDGCEMKKIWDWNDRFGEVRSANRRNDKRMMSLYI
jgi:SpoVK/Ycf46/Vps4 family AAA+-type ATPase